MVCQMVGSGSMDLTRYPARVATALWAILTATACQICKNTTISNLRTGIYRAPAVCLTMVSGGMEPCQSTTGMKKMLSNTTVQVVETRVQTALAQSSFATKIRLETSVQTGSMTTKTVSSILPIRITTVMQTAHPTMMTVTVSRTKTLQVGTLMVTEWTMVGKQPTD